MPSNHSNSPYSNFKSGNVTLVNDPIKKFKAERESSEVEKSKFNLALEDISYLDYTDIDLLSLRNSTTNYLSISDDKLLYKHVWAMFSNTQIVDSYRMSPYTLSKFIAEANSYYSKNNNPFHNF